MRLVPTPLSRLLIAVEDPAAGVRLGAALSVRFEIVGVVCDTRSAVALAAACTPDAVVLGVELPGGGAVSAACGIAAASPTTAIIVLSREDGDVPVLDLLRAGATSCCLSALEPHRLGDAIERAIAERQALVMPRAA